MKLELIPIVAVAALLAGCGQKESSSASAATNAEPNYNTGNPITAPVDYLGAVGQAQKHAEKVIDVSYINQDIQMFQASEGRLPKNLEELVPNYLAKIPAAPYGYKIVYDATKGTVSVVKQ
jgi:ABC-type glycerol-3-phosphate transport system substrate-binding protein